MPEQIELTRRDVPSPWLATKQVVADYEIVDTVGHGSIGVAYDANNRLNGRATLLKVIYPFRIDCQQTSDVANESLKQLAQIEHPNICCIFDVFYRHEMLCVASEKLEGNTLRECVQNDGPIPSELVYPIIRQCASALAFLHDKSQCHLHIKPSNLFLTTDGVVKLLDSGLGALHCDESDLERWFEFEDTKSFPQLQRKRFVDASQETLAYQSPQQSERVGQPNATCDLFALGCTGYFLLTGESFARDQGSRTGIDSDRFSCVPDEWRSTIKRMTAMSPNDRFRSASELIDALDLVFGDGLCECHDDFTVMESEVSNDVADSARHFVDGPSLSQPKSFWTKLGTRCRQVFGQ